MVDLWTVTVLHTNVQTVTVNPTEVSVVDSSY